MYQNKKNTGKYQSTKQKKKIITIWHNFYVKISGKERLHILATNDFGFFEQSFGAFRDTAAWTLLLLVVDPGLSRCVWVASVCDCSDYWLLTQLSLVAFVASLVHWAVVVSPTTTLLKTAWTPTRIELTEQGNAPDNLEQVSTQTIQTLVHNFPDQMAFLYNLQNWPSKLAPFLLYIVKMGKYTCHWPSKYLSWPLKPYLIRRLVICSPRTLLFYWIGTEYPVRNPIDFEFSKF